MLSIAPGDVEAGDQILMVDLGRGGGGAPASRSASASEKFKR